MLNWFSGKESEAFGLELAAVVKDFVTADPSMGEAKRQSKSNYAKEKMLKRIKQFKSEESLNFYKTAKLLNTFKWDLKDAGYPSSVIDPLAEWVLMSLQSPSKP